MKVIEEAGATVFGKKEKENYKRLGIKLKLLGILLPVVIMVMGSSIYQIYRSTSRLVVNKSEDILISGTESVVNKVKAWMNETITALNTERDTLEYFSLSVEDELEYIKHTANQYDSFPAGIYVATTDGNLEHASFVPGPEFNVFEKPWYIDGLESEKFIFGSVYFDEDSENYVVGASGVLKDKNGAVRGVAAADIYLNAISDIVKDVKFEKTGGIFLVDANTDTIIGHAKEELVGGFLTEQEDEIYAKISSLVKDKKFGMQTFVKQDGKHVILEIEQVPDSSFIAVAFVPENEVMADFNTLTQKTVITAAIGILILIVLMERLIHLIIKPLKRLNITIGAITNGDFTKNTEIRSKDEIGMMGRGIQSFLIVMRNIFQQIIEITTKLKTQSVSNMEISENLSKASDRQSVSIEEMKRTISELAISISEVAESTANLSGLVLDTEKKGEEAEIQMKSAVEASDNGRRNMEKIVDSMQDIAGKMQMLEKSSEQMDGSVDKINSIVDLIRNIAEETNLLALNASIEAARAGEAGRGFAVVASQIGKLAQTSKEAVNDIASLTAEISGLVKQAVQETRNSAEAIKDSASAVDETGIVFHKIYDSIGNTDKTVTVMVNSVRKVNDIAANIAGITQQQSAASEEILATAETIKGNADDVLERSKDVAKDASELKENADKLEEHMNMFHI